MIKRILLRFRDMKTIGKLIAGADVQANAMGEEKPGAEHFVLSALALEDGTAKRVFESTGLDSEKFRDAIKEQYDQALSAIGINSTVLDDGPEPVDSSKMLHDSKPSGQGLIKSLYELKKNDKERPLQGAHVLIVAAAIEHGVVPRAFKVLGVDPDLLISAARKELAV